MRSTLRLQHGHDLGGVVVTLRINMWSSPRNLSTALMYSWRQRADTTVVDEPLYGYYLSATGRVHPGSAEVIQSQQIDGEAVVRDVLLADYDTPVVFFKQMAKHLLTLDRSFLTSGPNVLLTREPTEMLSSLQVQIPDLTIDDTGFTELLSILDGLVAAGSEPIVIDSTTLLQNPRRVLTELCERVGLDFDEVMLTWPAGPKPEDGVWAPHWYDRVWQSTGWEPFTAKNTELSAAAKAVLPEATDAYKTLSNFRIT